jgi:hypothetical protein
MSDNGVTDDVLDFDHIEENLRKLTIAYGSAKFTVQYKPVVAGKRKFQRTMNATGEGFVPDDLRETAREEGEDDGQLADRLFFEGMVKVLSSWSLVRQGEPVAIRVETFRESWFVDDILAVIWLEILNDLEPGKAARRRAASLRREVGLGAGFPGSG